MMAISLDGKIGKSSQHFADWTSKEDKKMFAQVSKNCGVVLMGENTFKTFPTPLKERLNVVFSEREDVLDHDNLRYVKGDPKLVLRKLEEEGYEKVLLGGGSFLNSLFLEEKLIDEIMLTIEPKIFGQGLSLFNKDFEADLELLDLKKINDNAIFVHYKIVY